MTMHQIAGTALAALTLMTCTGPAPRADGAPTCHHTGAIVRVEQDSVLVTTDCGQVYKFPAATGFMPDGVQNAGERIVITTKGQTPVRVADI